MGQGVGTLANGIIHYHRKINYYSLLINNLYFTFCNHSGQHWSSEIDFPCTTKEESARRAARWRRQFSIALESKCKNFIFVRPLIITLFKILFDRKVIFYSPIFEHKKRLFFFAARYIFLKRKKYLLPERVDDCQIQQKVGWSAF